MIDEIIDELVSCSTKEDVEEEESDEVEDQVDVVKKKKPDYFPADDVVVSMGCTKHEDLSLAYISHSLR